MKDRIECLLAVMVIGTICYLAIVGKVEIATLTTMGMYVIKKFLDGIQTKKESKNEKSITDNGSAAAIRSNTE